MLLHLVLPAELQRVRFPPSQTDASEGGNSDCRFCGKANHHPRFALEIPVNDPKGVIAPNHAMSRRRFSLITTTDLTLPFRCADWLSNPLFLGNKF